MSFSSYENEEISEINVTPFVDVLLVLLVIFMVTVPLVTKTIAVNLPEEGINAPVEQNKKRFTVSINSKGEYFYQEKKKSLKEFDIIIKEWKSAPPPPTVFVRGDKNAKYGTITKLMSKLKNQGIQKIGLSVKERIR